MPEFRVVLDGLELDDREHEIVSQAVLEAGLKAVSGLRRSTGGAFAALSAEQLVVEDWQINGGWLIRDRIALEARESLQEQGVLPRELGGPLGHG